MPVDTVSWEGARNYCKKMGLRLPTEAEWEYAARAGTDLLYAGSNIIDDVVWYDGNSGPHPHPVATKDPNGWGLYDMSGNVWEWNWDLNYSAYYSSSPSDDPEGPPANRSNGNRVLRGGAWSYDASNARVAKRSHAGPWVRPDVTGFRLSRTIP